MDRPKLKLKNLKKVYDRVTGGEITIVQVKQALTDLDGSRIAKDKYNSVFHGFNTYLKTIINGR